MEDGSAVVIPAGTEHNIVNSSRRESLKLYTVYSPPEHPDGTVHRNKAEALAYEKEHHHYSEISWRTLHQLLRAMGGGGAKAITLIATRQTT